MDAIGRILKWLTTGQFLYLHMIRHDIPERDRRWFAECQMRYFSTFPWAGSDLARILLVGTIGWGAPLGLYISAGTALAMVLACEAMAKPLFGSIPEDAWKARLNAMRGFLLVRALAWSFALGVMVRFAPPTHFAAGIVLATVVVIFDIMYTAAMPVVAYASAAMIALGISGALFRTPGVDRALVVLIAVMQLVGMHYAVFNMHYLFATRRLRTRRLSTANDTIRLLLSQYDEHSSDFLVEVDLHGRLAHPSAKLCEMLGRTPDELDGTLAVALFEPGREVNAMMSAGRNQRRFRNHTLPLLIAGERRWWSVSGCPIYDSEGRFEGFRAFVQDNTEKRAVEERVNVMATRDALTGLANRAVFTQHLEDIYAAKGAVPDCVLLCIDLDSFKMINDTCGHAAGDAVLRETASRISSVVSSGSTVARLGGDEFAILLKTKADIAGTSTLGETLVEVLSRPMRLEDKSLVCGASIGIARGPHDGTDPDALMRAADIALYAAKSGGRRRCLEFNPDMLRELQDHRRLEMDLRNALDRGQFEIHYQPLIDIATRSVAGYEALLRWNHPKRGQISPTVFIPMAEETDLIVPIGEWVLREALAEAAGWKEDLKLAVNVSPAQMRGDALLLQVISALAGTGVSPTRLELEITENLLMEECEVQLRTLHQLRSFGVRIALDDFGTGYSSLNYLRSFPFDKLKIDRCFVKDLTVNPDSRSIVDTVINLARKFDMETIAEGVEHESQLTILSAMGCQQAQGYLFNKAIPAHLIPKEQRREIAAVPAPVMVGVVPIKPARAPRISGAAADASAQALPTTLSGRSVPNTRW